MSITIQAAGGTTVNASYNSATGLVSFEVTFSNGVTLEANSANLANRVQNIITTGSYAGQPFTSSDLVNVQAFLSEVPSIISRTSQLAEPQPVSNDANSSTVPSTESPASVATEPAAISADQDPAEAERLAAEERLANQESIEYNEPPDIGEEDPVEALNEQTRLEAEQEFNRQELAREEEAAGGFGDFPTTQGVVNETRSKATQEDAVSFQKAKDWRVRLSLAPESKYLYNNKGNEGILAPLAATNGVIFPYTPSVSVVYSAAYDASELIHSNYKIYNYKNSSVDVVNITCDFTAQDTNEANYLLAVIHFFKSVTKMFYGKDENPRNGTPPPLCYLSGLGSFQFDNHPLAVTSFNYTLPTDVDYIRAGSITNQPGNPTNQQLPRNNTYSASYSRMQNSGLMPKVPNFQRQAATINSDATYVPTKMQISITCIPIVTRNDISNNFSLKDYATGSLLQGSKRKGGGIW